MKKGGYPRFEFIEGAREAALKKNKKTFFVLMVMFPIFDSQFSL
jgi:hypothetical protein